MNNIRVNDLIHRGGNFWEVTGVYLGIIGQENLIGAKRLDKKSQNDKEIMIPEEMIAKTSIYRVISSVSKIEELVGKTLIRTGENKSGDTSYTNTAIHLKSVTDHALIFADGQVLTRKYWDDGKWILWDGH